MKVIVKPIIKEYDAIQVLKNKLPMVLVDTEELKQKILVEKDQIILREHRKENTEKYKSELTIDVFLKDGDYLIKTELGYMKPYEQVLEYTERVKKILGK